MGKIGTHITLKCANCGGNHQVTAFSCSARLKAQAEGSKEKVKKSKSKSKQPAIDWAFEEKPAVRPSDIECDAKVISYTRDLEEEAFGLKLLEGNMPEDSQNNR